MLAANTSVEQQLAIANGRAVPGGCFLTNLPWADPARQHDWLGQSLCWVPDCLRAVRGPVYSVASSRLGRYPHRRRLWFDMLRHAVYQTRQQGAAMLVCAQTAAAPWVEFAVEQLQCPSIRVTTSRWDHDFFMWLDHIAINPPVGAISIAPPTTAGPVPESLGERTRAARHDAVAVAMADRLYVPWVRPGGNIDRLVERRLADDRFALASTWVAVDPDEPYGAEKLARRAVGWFSSSIYQADSCDPDPTTSSGHVSSEQHSSGQPSSEQPSSEQPSSRKRTRGQTLGRAVATESRFISWDELLAQRGLSAEQSQRPFLVHCTRERSGPWPDQSDEQYRHELLMGTPHTPGDVLDTLTRIATMGRLVASSRINRGNQPVVCFSARSLPDLLHARTFRSHLGRWDYEPYGVGVSRAALVRKGARQVIYGDDQTFAQLSAAQQTFFQHRGVRNDWTYEREWRVANDVDLADIDPGDGFFFVPSVDDALRLEAALRESHPGDTKICHWPIVLVS